jgi:16S rRNA (cytosine967-C5)-methyltransferase
MTPGARAAAAIEVLDAWLAGAPAERALTRWARGARYAGSGDRAAVRDLVYDALRRRQSAARLGGASDGRGLVLGAARLAGADPGALFSGAGYAPPPLTDAERAHLAKTADPAGWGLDPAQDIPDWLRADLAARTDRPEDLFAALADRAPVWLRVARRRADRAGAQAALAADGIVTRAHPDCETALEVTEGARRIRSASAYLDGLVELQDLSAQRAVASVDWPAQGAILDFCAGGGGKALAIADRGGGRIFAHDSSAARMSDIPARASRAGVSIEVLAPGTAVRHAPYDAVLCDVPCSGAGTWRRDPEAKWRLTPERLAELVVLQAGILDEAAVHVAPGGLLVYMTCSLLARENEDQIAAFAARSPGWQQVAARLDTPLTASDGFFTAVLRAPRG